MKKIKKHYQEELLNYFKDINLKGKESKNNTILDHEAYHSIMKSQSESELNKNFLLELELRQSIIKLLIESNIIPDNLFEKLMFNTTEEYLIIVKNYFRLIKEFRFIKNSEMKIKYISLKKLLFNYDFKDRVIDTLNYNIKRFYPDSISNKKKHFFDSYSFGIIFDREKEFELYSIIKKEIFEYIYNGNIESFEYHGKNFIGNDYKTKFEYKDFINNFIEDEIFNDLSITIDYLKKTKLYDQYIEQLREAYYMFIGRTQMITLGTDISDYNDKNMVSIDMNFGLPIEVLLEQLKFIYTKYSSTTNDYELLFNKTKEVNIIKDTNILGNRTNILEYLKENEFLDVDPNFRNVFIKNQLVILNLFIFDSIYLGLDADNIDEVLSLKYQDFDYQINMINNKHKYFKDILTKIKNI